MKLINIEVEKFIFSEDVEIRVYFFKWKVATFRVDVLTEIVTRK